MVAQQSTALSERTLPNLTLKEFVLWLLGRRSRFRITGNSMLPLLNPNDEVLINPNAYRHQSPQPGDIIVAIHPNQPELKIVKGIDAVDNERCFLLGKNPAESTDSRSFGWVENILLQGQVTCRFGS